MLVDVALRSMLVDVLLIVALNAVALLWLLVAWYLSRRRPHHR
jgi:hypothetical protein